MRALLVVLVAASILPIPSIAQQPSAPSPPKKSQAATVRQCLHDTAAGGPTAFEVRWQPVPGGAAAMVAVAMPEVEVAQGSFAADLLQVQMQGGKQQTWLQVGRHSLSREKDGVWRLAGARATPQFLPDPALMLRALAANTPETMARSIAERDGVAVEQITVCLTPAQINALVFAGAIYDPCPSQTTVRSMVKRGQAKPEDVPVPVVDVCLDVDVATRLIRRIHLRAIAKKVDLRGLMLNAPARVPAAPAADEPDAKVADAAPASVPKEWKDGLPVRDENGMQVVWIEFVLRDHGKAPAVALDDTQKALLGR